MHGARVPPTVVGKSDADGVGALELQSRKDGVEEGQELAPPGGPEEEDGAGEAEGLLSLESERRRQLLGAVVAFVASAAFHSLYSFCAKVSTRSFPIAQIMWSRYSVQFVCTSALLLRRGLRLQACCGATLCFVLVGRGAFGFASQACHTYAVSRLPLADAVSVHSTYPVLTALLAPLALDEPLSMQAIASAAVAVLGCVLITQGRMAHHSDLGRGGEERSALGLGAAFLGAVFASLTYMVIRWLMRGGTGAVNPELVVWAYAAFGVVFLLVTLPVSAGHFVWHASWDAWVVLLAVGAVSVAEQLLVTLGFRRVPAGFGTLLLTLETCFAFAFSLVVLQEPIRWTTTLGGVLIGGAVAVSSVQQALPVGPPDATEAKVVAGRGPRRDGREKVSQSDAPSPSSAAEE